MAAITVRNLSETTHRALKARAVEHGRSTEAEVRSILDAAMAAEPRVRLGSLLVDLAHTGSQLDLRIERDSTPHEPVDLS